MSLKFTRNGQELVEDFVAMGHHGKSIVVPFQNLFVWDDATLAAYGITKTVEEPAPTRITRAQCAKELLRRGMITVGEAKKMARDGTPPAVITQKINKLPNNKRDDAEIDFADTAYRRGNPLLIQLLGEDLKQFFRDAANG